GGAWGDDAGMVCSLRRRGCWELVHRDTPASIGPAWRDGSSYLCVATTERGGTVDAGALLAGLARAASRAGATIHQHCPVLGLEPGPPATLRSGGGSVIAGQVVLALNAYTASLVSLPEPLSAALTLALATEPVGADTLAALGLGERRPFYTADLPYLWGRVLADRRLVFGAGLVFPGAAPVTSVDCRGAEATAALARLETRVRGLHPALAGIEIPLRWGGPIAFRSERTPLLARLPAAQPVLLAGGSPRPT